MKKSFWSKLAIGLSSLALLAGCSSNSGSESKESGSKSIDTLKVAFVPSRDPEAIVTATEPLKELLKQELAKEGYNVNNVDITVGTSFDAVGEALASGSADVGFLPGGTYVLYDKEVDVLLTATRDNLLKDSSNPKDWNDGKPTERGKEQANSYKGLIIAGPTEKGKELAAKINSGQELTWDDLNSAKWGVLGTSSSSGYIYPGAMLVKAGINLDKDISYQFSGGHDKSLQLLLNKDVDVIATFDGVEDRYAKDFPQAKTDIQKLATSDMIPGVMVTTSSKMDKELQEKLEKALRDVENDPKMKELFTKMFSITGFTDVDQDAYKKVEATAKVMNVDLDKVK